MKPTLALTPERHTLEQYYVVRHKSGNYVGFGQVHIDHRRAEAFATTAEAKVALVAFAKAWADVGTGVKDSDFAVLRRSLVDEDV